MGRRITVGSEAVAVGLVREALMQAASDAWSKGLTWHAIEIAAGRGEFDTIADHLSLALVDLAWDVEYKARAERLVLTFDAGVTSEDAARSIPETQPMSAGDGSPDDLAATGAPCPNISNGEHCRYYAGHTGPHTFGGGLKDPISKRQCNDVTAHEPHAWPAEKPAYTCSGRQNTTVVETHEL